MNRKFAPLFLVGLTFLLYACGGGGGYGGGGGNPISVAFATAPPQSLAVSATASISANVTYDSANAGVTWSCAPSGSCGSFSPASTASGATTTYTAPSTVPSGGSVTITAASVTDKTKSVSATVTITATTITVSISTAPPATLPTSGTASIAATTNDSAGVKWSCTPANTCGTFNPTSTLTTATTTYTAPATVPSGGSVTITATSVTNSSVSASTTVVITGAASLSMLKGQYAFLLTAPTGLRGITYWIGSVTLDGNGGVTGGIEEIASPLYNGDVADPILATGATGSSSGYTVDPTGHGRLVLSTAVGETLGMSFVLTSATHAEVIEADGPGGAGGDPASGTMDLQTPASPGAFSVSQISGTYSFTMTGIDVIDAGKPMLSFGGVLNTASPFTGTLDTNNGSTFASPAITQGSIDSGPDANGRGTLHIVTPSATVLARTFVYYIVNSKVLRLIEADGNADMGGSAYIQPTSAASLSGNFVYQHSGWSSTGRTVAAGQLSAATTTISGGVSDSNAGASAPTAPTTAHAVSGSFAVSATETGTLNVTLMDAAGTSTLNAYLVDPSINILDPNNTSGGGGALLLHTDANITGTGIVLPQAAPKAFLANYALNLANSIAATTPNELDLVGVLSADGNSSFGTTNLADYDENSSTTTNPMIGATLAGTFAADTSHSGRYTGSFTVTQPASSATGTPYPFIPSTAFTVAIYPTGNSQAFIVETDAQANIIGHLLLQILP